MARTPGHGSTHAGRALVQSVTRTDTPVQKRCGLSDTRLSLSAIRPSSGSEPAFILCIAPLRCTFTVASAIPISMSEADFRSHAASRQALLALVGAGFGIAIATEPQAAAPFPEIAFRRIDEPDAFLQLDLAWMPEAEEPALGRFIAFVRDATASASD
jgi:DNA-binding transcriptional LysR family regulator